jgi:hypothetical protein
MHRPVDGTVHFGLLQARQLVVVVVTRVWWVGNQQITVVARVWKYVVDKAAPPLANCCCRSDY